MKDIKFCFNKTDEFIFCYHHILQFVVLSPIHSDAYYIISYITFSSCFIIYCFYCNTNTLELVFKRHIYNIMFNLDKKDIKPASLPQTFTKQRQVLRTVGSMATTDIKGISVWYDWHYPRLVIAYSKLNYSSFLFFTSPSLEIYRRW